MTRPFLSIVIPAHNEESRLLPSLAQIGEFLRRQDFRAEIIIVEADLSGLFKVIDAQTPPCRDSRFSVVMKTHRKMTNYISRMPLTHHPARR